MSVEEHKRIARLYYQFNPDDIDQIVRHDMVGHTNPGTGFDWGIENHKQFWSKEENRGVRDVVHEMIAEGDYVAVRLTREGTHQGKEVHVEMMHLIRFEDGQIVEMWAYADSKQWAE